MQVTWADWLWPMLPLSVLSSSWLCAQYRSWEGSFSRLAPFLDDSKRPVLIGDWSAILDLKIDRVSWRARRLWRCESSLVGFMACHDLADRFFLNHLGREMWTWLDSPPTAEVGSYLDRVLVRRADSDFVSCPTFNLIAWTDHKFARVTLRLAKRPSLVGYWKFNTSLPEIPDFRDRWNP